MPQLPQWPQRSFYWDILHIAVPAQNVSGPAFGSRLNSNSKYSIVRKARTEGFDSTRYCKNRNQHNLHNTALRLNHKAKLPLHRHCQKWPGLRLKMSRETSKNDSVIPWCWKLFMLTSCWNMFQLVKQKTLDTIDTWDSRNSPKYVPRLQGLLGLTAIEAHGLELQRAFLVITPSSTSDATIPTHSDSDSQPKPYILQSMVSHRASLARLTGLATFTASGGDENPIRRCGVSVVQCWIGVCGDWSNWSLRMPTCLMFEVGHLNCLLLSSAHTLLCIGSSLPFARISSG